MDPSWTRTCQQIQASCLTGRIQLQFHCTHSCSLQLLWVKSLVMGGQHIMFSLKALLAQAGLSGLSGEKLLSLYFNLLSGPKIHQARRRHSGMLHYILASPEYCHFSEQMPIKRAWCQAFHLQDVLCFSVPNHRLMGTAAPSFPEGALQILSMPIPPVSVKTHWHLVEKTTLYLIYN